MYQTRFLCETCRHYKDCKADWWMEKSAEPIFSAFDDTTFEEAMEDIDCEEYEEP